MNYQSFGYVLLMIGSIVLTTQIARWNYEKHKGRDKLRIIVNPFNRPQPSLEKFAVERVKAGDPDWIKFLRKPPE